MILENSILFVCAENVCRSPLMAYEFLRAARGAGTDGQWRVSSAGARTRRSQRACSVVAELVGDDEAVSGLVSMHRSRPLTAAMINKNDLIITASLAERATVATLSPASRDRTFTLREAVSLASERRLPQVTSVRELGHQLHSRRGLIVPVTQDGRHWLRRAEEHPFDIPDTHSSRSRRHIATLRASRDLVVTLQTRLDAALSGIRHSV